MTPEDTKFARAHADGGGAPPPAATDLGSQAYKAILILFAAAAIIVPLALVALPYIEFLNDMAVQPKGKPQGLYGRSAGLEIPVERAPAKGSIATGAVPYRYETNALDVAAKAGKELVNPYRGDLVTEAVLERGRKVYAIHCYPCHGSLGEADGPVVGPNRFPAPPSLTSTVVKNYPDGKIFHIITKGQNVMPGYDDTIPPDDRWVAVWFVRVLRATIDGAKGGER